MNSPASPLLWRKESAWYHRSTCGHYEIRCFWTGEELLATNTRRAQLWRVDGWISRSLGPAHRDLASAKALAQEDLNGRP